MRTSPWYALSAPSSFRSESFPSACLISLSISIRTRTAGLQAGGLSMMEVRFFPTRWLGMDKDRGWWTLRNRGAIAAKFRGQRHSMAGTDKKMDCIQRCDITEA